MNITGARYEDGELHLACSPRDGMAFAMQFKAGNYEIKEEVEKRGMKANAYAWVLINKIAEKLRLDPIEVYRNEVEHTPGVTARVITCSEEDVPHVIRDWEAGHIGRQVRQIPNGTPGYTDCWLVYGSSDYDRHQMSVFLDRIIQDATALEIDVRDPADVESMLSKWE